MTVVRLILVDRRYIQDTNQAEGYYAGLASDGGSLDWNGGSGNGKMWTAQEGRRKSAPQGLHSSMMRSQQNASSAENH